MDKDKAHHNHSALSMSHAPVPVPPGTDDASTVADESARHKSVGKDLLGGDAGGGGGGAKLGTLAAAFGAKPTNFFELLAAAISATKLEQQKVPDFIDYLKKSGIKMAWVRAIVALYEEPKKPDDPLAYIVKLMGLGIPEPIDVKRMQDQVSRLRVKLLSLQTENIQLQDAIEVEEEAIQKKEELVSLFGESKYFTDYNSDDDYSGAEEMQQQQHQQSMSYKFSYSK